VGQLAMGFSLGMLDGAQKSGKKKLIHKISICSSAHKE